MLKLTGLLCVVICGGGIGFYAAGKLNRQMKQYMAICQLFSAVGIRMRWHGDSTAELLRQLSGQTAFSGLYFLRCAAEQVTAGVPFPAAWRTGVQADKRLDSAVQELLLALGETLGTSDLAGQLVTLEQYQEQMTPYCTEAAKRYQQLGRVYRSVGILGGAAVALLLC